MSVYHASDMILYENEEILVCHKPSGLAVQNARIGHPDLESILKNDLYQRTGKSYLGIIHRLDQPVEGLLVFAKTPSAAKILSSFLQNGKMGKEYLAVAEPVQNWKKSTEMITLQDYLQKKAGTNLSEVVGRGTPGAKKARLSYRILDECEDRKRVLLYIKLDTGRHHQIRVQMSHAGLPLVGDQKYGIQMEQGTGQKLSGLALCAFRLTVPDPCTGEQKVFQIQPNHPAFHVFSVNFPESMDVSGKIR